MKCCVFCKHWDFYPGHPGYSVVTPAENWESGCNKGLWLLSGHEVSRKDYREALKTAERCEYYEEV